MSLSPTFVELFKFNEEEGTFILFPGQSCSLTLLGTGHADAQRITHAFLSGEGLSQVLQETGGRIKEYDDLVYELILCRVAADQLAREQNVTEAEREDWVSRKEDQLVKERVPHHPYNWEDYTQEDPGREFEAEVLVRHFQRSIPFPKAFPST